MGVMHQSLLEDGIFVVPIIYPAVSRNNCRFRFTMNSKFNSSDIDYVTMSLEKAMAKAKLRFDE
jgi:7-keto-8-aminopelargonate synthetase-like enzyme